MKFTLRNYNEFKTHMGWHDYVSVLINEFPIILVRRYDWFDLDQYTFMVQILGFKVYQQIGKYQ